MAKVKKTEAKTPHPQHLMNRIAGQLSFAKGTLSTVQEEFRKIEELMSDYSIDFADGATSSQFKILKERVDQIRADLIVNTASAREIRFKKIE